MSDIALRPRSATELVDAAFQLYRRQPLQFIVGLGLIYVPWMLLLASLGLQGRLQAGANGQPNLDLVFTILLVSGFGGIFIYTLAGGITTVLANDVYFGREADIGKAYKLVVVSFVSLLLTLLLVTILGAIGFVLLFIPGLYVFARLFAVKQVILLEGGNTNAALSRSSFLSKGMKRHIINTMGLVVLLNIAVALGAGMLGGLFGSDVIKLVINTAVTVLVYPLFGITETLLYYDVRIRREGFDIEYLAAASSPIPSEPATT